MVAAATAAAKAAAAVPLMTTGSVLLAQGPYGSLHAPTHVHWEAPNTTYPAAAQPVSPVHRSHPCLAKAIPHQPDRIGMPLGRAKTTCIL